ncbi:TauD/TfdA family dioxygenase [Nocardia sp. NPDC052566]|uniref:TauD/TfdA family dioxygenase n=1 Tax=Nocardia sp. NPDC052566 TaxID=3364330 RepID=UPI0037C98F07
MKTVDVRTHRTDMIRITLPNDIRDAMTADLADLDNPEDDPDRATTIGYKAFALLPDHMLQAILDFGRHVDAPGVALVENLPRDPRLPPTPANGGPYRDKPSYIAEGVLLGLSGLLGEPVGFSTERDGRIIHDIIPTQDGASTQTSRGSDVLLNFHNDIVHDVSGRYDISNPDFLVLNCLRADMLGEAMTCYVDARDLLDNLDSDVVAALRAPDYRLNAPGGYTQKYADGAEVLSEPVPLITGPEHSPEVYVAANGVKRLTETAEQAFNELQRVCRETDIGQVVKLEPGQALLINNRKGLHSRSQFRARYDGTDRWLQRTYIRKNLWNIREQASPMNRRTHR